MTKNRFSHKRKIILSNLPIFLYLSYCGFGIWEKQNNFKFFNDYTNVFNKFDRKK